MRTRRKRRQYNALLRSKFVRANRNQMQSLRVTANLISGRIRERSDESNFIRKWSVVTYDKARLR